MSYGSKMLGVSAVAAASFMVIGGTAFAGQPTNTNFLHSGSSQRGTIEGAVGVCEQDQQECGAFDGTMKVKLFKKKDGAWVKIAAKQATKESESLWSVTFTNAPRAGKCKMVALYSSSATYDPSRDATKGGCTDPHWPL